MRLFGSTWAVQIVKGVVIPPKSTTVTIPSTCAIDRPVSVWSNGLKLRVFMFTSLEDLKEEAVKQYTELYEAILATRYRIEPDPTAHPAPNQSAMATTQFWQEVLRQLASKGNSEVLAIAQCECRSAARVRGEGGGPRGAEMRIEAMRLTPP